MRGFEAAAAAAASGGGSSGQRQRRRRRRQQQRCGGLNKRRRPSTTHVLPERRALELMPRVGAVASDTARRLAQAHGAGKACACRRGTA